MQICFADAITAYASLPRPFQVPSLHPYYVRMDALTRPGASAVYFSYRNGGEQFYHPFILQPVAGMDYFDIESAYGYGGPVATSEDPVFLAAAWQAYRHWCNDNRVLVEFLRFHPQLENWKHYDGSVIDNRQTVAIDLCHADLLMSFKTRTRTTIRKALKNGLTVRPAVSEQDFSTFTDIYRETMQRLSAAEMYFFPQQYFTELYQWEDCQLLLCEQAGKILAGAIFLRGADYLEYHLSAATDSGRQLGATNLLLYEGAVRGQQQQCSILHLGGGNTAAADNPLLFFKRGFSERLLDYKIGKFICAEHAYAELKQQWQLTNQRTANKVLFYREE